MFGVPQLYSQWLKTVKSIKSENHSLFYNNNDGGVKMSTIEDEHN